LSTEKDSPSGVDGSGGEYSKIVSAQIAILVKTLDSNNWDSTIQQIHNVSDGDFFGRF
jgi:hypothetical protein